MQTLQVVVYEVWTVHAQVGKYMCVHLLMMCICHCAGSIPDHPTSFKLTWDLEIEVSPKSVLCDYLKVFAISPGTTSLHV